MSMTDPIADFLTGIRNAILARHSEVTFSASKMKARIAQVLKDEGYILDYSFRLDRPSMNEIIIKLRWADPRTNAITGLRRRSRPGQRMYVRHAAIPRVRSGLGIAILSTSRGLMTDRAARKAGVGGELVCEVW